MSQTCSTKEKLAASEPTIDYSSEQAFQTSLEKMKMPLDDNKKRELEISLLAIEMELRSKDKAEQLPKVLNGKTANEIIGYAEQLE